MNWSAISSKLFDPYDMKARIFPGLLLLTPVVVFMALILGPKNPLIIALSSVLATCGGPYLIASFVRTWGQRAERRLNKKWGGQPTTIMLRHRDTLLPAQTTLLYHKLIKEKFGLVMPTEDQEKNDGPKADGYYIAAANALRPLTNDHKKFPFIFKELVAYGFNRNAHGSRFIGALISIMTMFATLLHGGALTMASPYLDLNAFKGLTVAYVLTLITCATFLLVWLFHFTAQTVEQAGYSYARRLWEALDKVPKKPVPKVAKSGGQNGAGVGV